MKALGMHGDRESIAYLADCVGDSESDMVVRRCAIEALGLAGYWSSRSIAGALVEGGHPEALGTVVKEIVEFLRR